jgi:hypothetical protein
LSQTRRKSFSTNRWLSGVPFLVMKTYGGMGRQPFAIASAFRSSESPAKIEQSLALASTCRVLPPFGSVGSGFPHRSVLPELALNPQLPLA